MFKIGAGFYVYDIGLLIICIISMIVFGTSYFKGKDLKLLLGFLISLSMIISDSRLLHSHYKYVNIFMTIINICIWICYFMIIKQLYFKHKNLNS